MNHPGHIFALAIFGAVGLSHTFRPRIWMDYVAWLAAQGRAGVALYASLHALPGAILIALAGTDDWTGWVLTCVGAALVLKAALYCMFPEVGIGKMRGGLRLAPWCWGIAGAFFLAFASIGAWGAWGTA
jgi:hypothetical protein